MEQAVILFDLDGTLIDSTEAILESFHHSFKVHKVSAPRDESIKSLIGHPLDIMYKELGISENRAWDFVQTYKEHYRKISRQKTYLLNQAKESIEKAATFARLGIVTTKTARYSKELLEHMGIMFHFETLIGRENVEKPKPDPEPIFKALEALSVTKNNVWMIGDTFMDILSAKNAGIEHVAVTSGYESRKSLEKQTTNIVENAYEAVCHIERVCKNGSLKG